jgi:hypothetical protein
MTEKSKNDGELLLFDTYLGPLGVRAQILFAKESASSNELHYLLNERRVERADFEAVMAACRASAAEAVAESMNEEGWILTALDRIGDNTDGSIADTFASKLIFATAAIADR